MEKTERIETITLRRTLPEVFADEPIPPSDIWKQTVTLRRGDRVLIEAASGTGKSSLCAYIYGSRRDYRGEILFGPTDTATLTVDDWQRVRRLNIAYLPQELSLFPELTALQNIELKNSLTGCVARGQIEEWLHELGIDSRANTAVGRMSIGQQQRVAFIRTLCQPFDFLLLDEPVSHLDAANNVLCAAMATREADARGAAIIATSVGNQLSIDNPVIMRL